MHVAGGSGCLFGLGFDVNRARGDVDYRRAGDADLRNQIAAFPGVKGGHSRHTGCRIDETDLPERRRVCAEVVIRVKGVDAVVLGRDKQDVVSSFAGDGKIGQVERLGVNVPVDGLRKEFTETVYVDVRQREDRFVGVLPGPRVVVMVGQNVDIPLGRQAKARKEAEGHSQENRGG